MSEANPLLEAYDLPPWSTIKPEHAFAALERVLASNREAISCLLEQTTEPAWDSLVEPLAELAARLERAWAPIAHLHGVDNTAEIRQVYERILPLLTDYSTELGQHVELYQAWSRLRESPAFDALSPTQQQSIDHTLRDFRLSGVGLQEAQKKRFADLQQELSRLGTCFSNNVLDATKAWTLHLSEAASLAGVPDAVLATLRQEAESRGLDGFVITLDIPSYLPVMQYAQDRSLRERLYQAYVTRASEQGPGNGCWDNSEIMVEILAARHELALLLNYSDYTEYSLACKMAEDSEQVLQFIRDLAAKARPFALQDLADLNEFAAAEDGLESLEAWDIPYYSERLRQARFAISQQELRPYFPVSRVIDGLFQVVGRLFDVELEQVVHCEPYHADVELYHIRSGGQIIASFYLDLYAREHKRGGAWMAGCRDRRVDGSGTVHLPVAFLVCNFTPPGAGQPSLLTHDEVTTLFHEFGHGLHHMLTSVDVATVSGINGVAWDAVELPSQFLENWCWQKEALALISGHHQTGEPLPEALLDKMLAARYYQSGLQMIRQLEFALFDFRLHREYRGQDPELVGRVLDEVRAEVSVIEVPVYNRFAHSFSHIFSGGYAAGYYSYKWAELLAADAYSRFEEEGIFNRQTGDEFKREILEVGGSRSAGDSFRRFRGRDPDSEALLRHSGLLEDVPA